MLSGQQRIFRLAQNVGLQEDGSGPISQLVLHPECFPIEIPSNDPFFSKHKQRCMNFVRSLPSPQLACTFGYGEQMNQVKDREYSESRSPLCVVCR